MICSQRLWFRHSLLVFGLAFVVAACTNTVALVDREVSAWTAQDCRLRTLVSEFNYCRTPMEPAETAPAVVCTPTIGRVDCYAADPS